MRRIVRTGIILVSLTVFIISGSVALQKEFKMQEGQEAYAAAEALAGLTSGASEEISPQDVPMADADAALAESQGGSEAAEEGEEAQKEKKSAPKSRPIPEVTIETLENLDMDALKKVNSDVEGWILIPGTKISYPVMQASDNEFYLSRTWDKTWNWLGSVFIECENESDLSEFNTIIYGHNMRGGSMFGTLKNYKKAKYWQEHPYIYIMHEGGVYRYEIFAAHKVQLNTIVYGMQIENPKQREELIRFALDYSAIDTGIEPTEDDKILTLSTCSTSAKARWVVQAVWNPEESYHKPQ